MKRCSNCFQTKSKAEFYPNRAKGPGYFQGRCKACNAEVVRGCYQRQRARKRAERWALMGNRAQTSELASRSSGGHSGSSSGA